ncbi:hypothetical protein [Anabaena sp. CS-542/02]|uniref:hypothetical protein n=1 Tax=Anabaena sp. CS-542/02 TaxID=3021719 RepID=UPI0023306E86|nr:hypothetical protein [Anabaena sp. CS-542/02]MDB9445499.1 hypothetical protein [Anabaena sp. CS-542/02]
MERYQVSVDKDSGITNNPNDWSTDPRYIVDLIKRVVRVSVETMKIVDSLPPLHDGKLKESVTAYQTQESATSWELN